VSTLSVVVHTYNPNTQKDEKGGSQIQGQPGLHREMLSQTATITKKTYEHLVLQG
jgi:hypothetical protein